MIRKGACKTGDRMAGNAFDAGIRVRWCGCLTDGRVTVMTAGTAAGDTRVIKAAIGFQCKKADGIVAASAFAIGRKMKF